MDSFRQKHPEYNIHNNVIRSFLKSNMEYSLKKIVHFVRPILQMVASRVLPNYKNTCFTSDQQPASRASVYTHLQNARNRHVPFPRFACWGVSAPSPKTHPENRMAAHLRRLYAGRLSLVLLRSLRSWRSLLRGKIRPQIFPVREQFPRLFPRVAVRRVSLFFLREQLTVFHIERLFRRELLQPKLVERTLCRAVPVDLLLMLF